MENLGLALLISAGLSICIYCIVRCAKIIFELLAMDSWEEKHLAIFVAMSLLLCASVFLLTIGVLGVLEEISA